MPAFQTMKLLPLILLPCAGLGAGWFLRPVLSPENPRTEDAETGVAAAEEPEAKPGT